MSLARALGKDPRITDWGASRARQSEAKYADINLIMAKYEKTGVLPPATREGFFADVSMVGDYRDAVARVEKMDEYFLHLPVDVRKKFEHDPAAFLDFVSDQKNLAEIEEMGLIAKSEEEVPVKPPVVAVPAEAPPEPEVPAPKGP